MTPEQQAWIDDLLTTDVPQTTGALHDTNGFCCLGRACVTLGIPPGPPTSLSEIPYEGEEVTLPRSAAERLGLRSIAGLIAREHVSPEWEDVILQDMENQGFPSFPHNLWQLNDELKWPFEKIGRFIQDNPQAVFK